ncbi:MAG: hypothetical protein HY698_16135 [Deltaproteobacteria bacterium]|nr:hypothetical protein [Deltaproteobacteria bacterium]
MQRANVFVVLGWALLAGCHSVSASWETDAESAKAADASRGLDVAVVDAGTPDAAWPDAVPADAMVPDVTVPDAMVPDVTVPDVTVPDATVPDATVPDATVPDVTRPECTSAADCAEPRCGQWSDCAFENTCSTEGIRTRTCVPMVCTASFTCAEGTPYEEEDRTSCPRETDGLRCGETQCTDFSDCTYDGDAKCDNTGVRTRACWPLLCSGGECKNGTATTEIDTATCARSTQGQSCGMLLCPLGPTSLGSVAGCCDMEQCVRCPDARCG